MICLLALTSDHASALKVTSVPTNIKKAYQINTVWYKKYTHVKGIPIIASKKVDSRALIKAAAVTSKMLMGKSYGKKITKYLKQYRTKIGIIEKKGRLTRMPEARHLEKSYDTSAAGLSVFGEWRRDSKTGKWKEYLRIALTREMNVLQKGYPIDKWSPANSILQHELAHNIHLTVFDNEYPILSKKIKNAYNAAIKKGKWKGSYAATDEFEYWAECSAIWFNNNTSDPYGKNYIKSRRQLKKYDLGIYRLLLKVYGNSKWRFKYGPKFAKTKYQLSRAFGNSLTLNASDNMFMVGEDFDLKIASTGASFSFDDYSYIDIAQSSGKSWQLGFKSEQSNLPQMGGNFAFGSQLGGIHYRVAADNTFLGSKGSGWLGYKDARSAYVNVGKQYSPGNKWNIAGDVTYGWSQADAEKEGVFQDFSKIHALGFNASAGYQLNTHNEIGIRLNSPLKVEKGSLVIKSPYDAEKVNLAPVGRELNLVLHHTHQFRNAATLTTSLQYTHDSGHARDQESSRIMAEYSITF